MPSVQTKYRIQAQYAKLADHKEVLHISGGELSAKPELFPHGEFIVMDVTVDGDLSQVQDRGYDGGGGSNNQDPTKKPSFAEKLMGVKNTQCDQFLQRVQTSISNDEMRSMVRIREDTNKVRYDFKEMDLVKKKRDLETKKKKNPFVDTEEDDFELKRMERYLFYNPNHCFYMEKKNSIPLRGTAKSDPYHVTPTVARARKIMQDITTQRSVEAIQEKRATMLSRKSMRSVRFQSRGDDEDDEFKPSPKDKEKAQMRPKSMRPFRSTPSATTIYQDPNETGMTKQEQLIAYLKRSKEQQQKYDSLIARSPGEDIPDDFTQCEPHKETTKPNSGYSRRSYHTEAESTYDVQSQASKPHSTYSKRSQHSVSDYDDNVFHLPSISGDPRQTPAGEVSETVQFGTMDELPPHEVALLKQTNKPPPPALAERPVKSAFIRRTGTQMSHANRRHTSTSAHSIKRRQVTHAMLRQEKAEVEQKVGQFLSRFRPEKPKHPRLSTRPSQATFKFKQQNTEAGTDQLDAPPPKPMVQWQTPAKEETPRTPRPKQPRGIPSHSQERSKRHTATFKLRKIVQDLMKNRTTSQQIEYDKMLEARKQGRKTPDLHAFVETNSPVLSDDYDDDDDDDDGDE